MVAGGCLMPGTKRTPIARSRTPLITPQIVDNWRRALKLNKRAHLSHADFELAYAAERDVDRALGIKLWNISIFEDEMFKHDSPPEYLFQQGRADGWYRTHELRRQLAEADRELRRQERAARRAKTLSPSPEQPPSS